MHNYIKELTKCLSMGVSMETKITGEASAKDAGIALKSLYIMVGMACLIIALGVFIWLVK